MVSLPRNSWSGLSERPGQISAEHIATLPRNTWSISAVYPYLKELAVICGIKKELTTHTARHTFATTVTLENDVPIETVGKMLGHKDLRSTQKYAKITKRKISNNMRALENKLLEMTDYQRCPIV